MNSHYQTTAVLVIRPKQQAIILAEMMREKGVPAIIFPTLNIVAPPDVAQTQEQLSQLADYDGLLFCTANAVERGVMYRKTLANEINASSSYVAAIGPSTAQALQHAGIRVNALPESDYSSEGLLALPGLQDVSGARLAIVAGVGGRPFLINTLRDRGAVVTKVETYARRCPVVNDFKSQQQAWVKAGVNIIVGSSFSSLDNLYQLAQGEACTWLLAQKIVVVSQRMKDKAAKLGFKQFIDAPNATDEAIVAAVTKTL